MLYKLVSFVEPAPFEEQRHMRRMASRATADGWTNADATDSFSIQICTSYILARSLIHPREDVVVAVIVAFGVVGVAVIVAVAVGVVDAVGVAVGVVDVVGVAAAVVVAVGVVAAAAVVVAVGVFGVVAAAVVVAVRGPLIRV